MPNSLSYTYNHLNKIIVAASFSIILGCGRKTNSYIIISPKNFKVQVPFILDARGIIINTYWGKEKIHHVLCLDNYSSSWLKSSVADLSKLLGKSQNLKFKTYTAVGTPVKGEVGVCDSFTFENITFKKALFYIMPSELKDNKNDDGVFGGDLMSTGIWKIDFKNRQLIFTSSIDSLKESKNCEVSFAAFGQEYIKINVSFGNNIAKTMAIDLGYNGEMILPLNDFNDITRTKKTSSRFTIFKTPASQNIVNSLSFFDTVMINHNWFHAMVSSNEKVKERLIGLQFLEKFDFVILDFINKKMYLPKKVW
ncbi:MAG TPA: hypothetical protein VNV85_02020 [Puia sp.]|jgi:hypothetical protein|nr:hypothetical protein [Puia sp.]